MNLSVVTDEKTNVSSLKGLRTGYIFVLAVVGILSLASYLLLGTTLLQQDTRGAEINMAGRQRMLTQRIGLLQFRFRQADSVEEGAKSLQQMTEATELMERSLNGLTRGDAAMGVSAASSPALKAMYFGPDMFVERDVRKFITLTHQFIQAAQSGGGVVNSSLLISSDSSMKLLAQLDRIVGQYQKENEDKIAQIQILRHLTVIVTLGVLLFSGLLVFRPMVTRIHRNVAELAAAE